MRGRNDAHLAAAFRRKLDVLTDDALEQFVKRNGLALGNDAADIETRYVEQRAQKTADRTGRAIDAADKLGRLGAQIEIAQAGGKETDGVDRLAQVVARMGEEPRLREIGLDGLGAGLIEFRRHPGEFGKARVERAGERDVDAHEAQHADAQDREDGSVEQHHRHDDGAEIGRVMEEMRGGQQRHRGPEADEAGTRQHMLRGNRAQRRAAQRQRIDQQVFEAARRRAESAKTPDDADKESEARMHDTETPHRGIVRRRAAHIETRQQRQRQ